LVILGLGGTLLLCASNVVWEYSLYELREDSPVSSMSATGGSLSLGPKEAMRVPPTLLEHVRKKVQEGLALAKAPNPAEAAKALVDAMLCLPECSSNKAVMQMGEKLGKAVRYCALQLPLPQERNAAAAAVGQMLAQYAEYIQSNNQIYDSITTHHANITQEDWGDVAADQEALSRYAAAAAAMGTKTW
jgi:hypothetical protein